MYFYRLFQYSNKRTKLFTSLIFYSESKNDKCLIFTRQFFFFQTASFWPVVFLLYTVGVFKPSTMEIFQRRVILEDTVHYKLFLVQSDSLNSKQTEERLGHLAEEILAKIAPLLIQYIWQHQSFHLKYHPEKGMMSSGH